MRIRVAPQAFVAVSLFSYLAAAIPSRRTLPASQCSTGSVQCCQSVESADSSSAAFLLGLLDIVVQDVSIPVGLTCDPISVIGVGGDSCTAQSVCCENNSFNGIIALGCTPVDLSL